MKKLMQVALASQFIVLSSCGGDSEIEIESTNLNQESEQTNRGVLTNQQETAMDAARTVEQTLLDAAADREEELADRLRQQ